VFGLPGKDLRHDEAKPHRARLGYYREGPIGILTTQFDGGLHARPLEARADRDAGLIWFVTEARGAKDDEIMADHDIGLVFIDEDDRAYLSITGRASVTRDTAKAKEIWKKTDDIWLQGGPCACFAWSRSLSLEKQRIELRNVVADIPTMDIGLAWNRL